MKILFCTQVMDREDAALSFFHNWITSFAPRFTQVTVFCLKKGETAVPANTSVHSLGKEKQAKNPFRRLLYMTRLLGLSIKHRNNYDAVFVHMNQEFILVSGLLWKLMGKRIYLWYNHYQGSMLTDIAASFCEKVFHTSDAAHTAKYTKAVQMPVGVDISKFALPEAGVRKQNSILFLGRIAPSKKAEVFIEALSIVRKKGHRCVGSIYGPTINAADEKYLKSLHALVAQEDLSESIQFYPGVPSSETPQIYSAHEVFVNCSKSGMYDKTMFEAAASGCFVVASSEDFRKLAGEAHYFPLGDVAHLAEQIISFLETSAEDKQRAQNDMRRIAEQHSLNTLGERLVEELQ